VAAAAPTVPSAYAPAPGMGESPTLLKNAIRCRPIVIFPFLCYNSISILWNWICLSVICNWLLQDKKNYIKSMDSL
jgi:hypothetical protein